MLSLMLMAKSKFFKSEVIVFHYTYQRLAGIFPLSLKSVLKLTTVLP